IRTMTGSSRAGGHFRRVLAVMERSGKASASNRRAEQLFAFAFRHFRRHECLLEQFALSAEEGVQIAVETRTISVENCKRQVDVYRTRLANPQDPSGTLVLDRRVPPAR